MDQSRCVQTARSRSPSGLRPDDRTRPNRSIHRRQRPQSALRRSRNREKPHRPGQIRPGNGPWPSTATASPSLPPPEPPTATTPCCWPPPSKPSGIGGLIPDIETLHLDRGYDSPKTRGLCRSYGITDIVCARKRPPGAARPKKLPAPLGMRWTVERTNSWLSNYGQLRRNTDRRPQHRQAQLRLAIALIIIIKLINWRNRWNPKPAPIR